MDREELIKALQQELKEKLEETTQVRAGLDTDSPFVDQAPFWLNTPYKYTDARTTNSFGKDAERINLYLSPGPNDPGYTRTFFREGLS